MDFQTAAEKLTPYPVFCNTIRLSLGRPKRLDSREVLLTASALAEAIEAIKEAPHAENCQPEHMCICWKKGIFATLTSLGGHKTSR